MKSNKKKGKVISRKMSSSKLHARPSPFALERFWKNCGFKAGQKDALTCSIANESNKMQALNAIWNQRATSKLISPASRNYLAAAKGYVEGFCKAVGMDPPDWVLMPTAKSVGAIVCVMNEESTIAKVLGELKRLPLDEIIIIVNGSEDKTLTKARTNSNALIVHYPDPLGHDVGRAIGAKLSHSDILIFLDGDFVVQAENLIPFIYDIEKGSDIALNNITPYLPAFSRWDSVTIMKRFLNVTLNRPDLQANSLTAVPHAISRNLLEQIGCSELMVPPKAQVRAILEGLRITTPSSINVISENKVRRQNKGRNNPVSRMIIGDHVEALQFAMKSKGERLVFTDTIRKRQYLEGEAACN